jgi:hypothetical protein
MGLGHALHLRLSYIFIVDLCYPYVGHVGNFIAAVGLQALL